MTVPYYSSNRKLIFSWTYISLRPRDTSNRNIWANLHGVTRAASPKLCSGKRAFRTVRIHNGEETRIRDTAETGSGAKTMRDRAKSTSRIQFSFA